jgi:hypothetical protein
MSYNLRRKSAINSSLEIKNGLLGVKRDVFLLLLAYMYFENGEMKIKSVRIQYFLFLFLFFNFLTYLLILPFLLNFIFDVIYCIDDGR